MLRGTLGVTSPTSQNLFPAWLDLVGSPSPDSAILLGGWLPVDPALWGLGGAGVAILILAIRAFYISSGPLAYDDVTRLVNQLHDLPPGSRRRERWAAKIVRALEAEWYKTLADPNVVASLQTTGQPGTVERRLALFSWAKDEKGRPAFRLLLEGFENLQEATVFVRKVCSSINQRSRRPLFRAEDVTSDGPKSEIMAGNSLKAFLYRRRHWRWADEQLGRSANGRILDIHFPLNRHHPTLSRLFLKTLLLDYGLRVEEGLKDIAPEAAAPMTLEEETFDSVEASTAHNREALRGERKVGERDAFQLYVERDTSLDRPMSPTCLYAQLDPANYRIVSFLSYAEMRQQPWKQEEGKRYRYIEIDFGYDPPSYNHQNFVISGWSFVDDDGDLFERKVMRGNRVSTLIPPLADRVLRPLIGFRILPDTVTDDAARKVILKELGAVDVRELMRKGGKKDKPS